MIGRLRFLAYVPPVAAMVIVGSYKLVVDVVTLLLVFLMLEGWLWYRRSRREQPTDRLGWGVVTGYVLVGSLAWWVLASVANDALAPRPRSLNSARFQDVEGLAGSRLAIALSGGGYRAAIFHAGVLDELESMNAPPRFLSSVSGGSIVGAYYVAGGDPAAFPGLVAEGRFLLGRFAFDFPRPFRLLRGDYARVHAQSEMLHDRLLGKLTFGDIAHTDQNPRPHLMICTSDLGGGLLVGWTSDAYLVHGLPRWVPRDTDDLPRRFSDYNVAVTDLRPIIEHATHPVGQYVAASGGFPGVFSPLMVDRLSAAEIDDADEGSVDAMYLADGGLIDNSGVSLLLAADAAATRDPGSAIADFSGIGVIVESDASAIADSMLDIKALMEVLRSIDVTYLESQAAGRLINAQSAKSSHLPIIRISPSRFFIRRPLITRAELSDTYQMIMDNRDSEHVQDLYRRIRDHLAANPDDAARAREGDVTFLLDVYQMKLMELKIRGALARAGTDTVLAMMQICPGIDQIPSVAAVEASFASFRRHTQDGLRTIPSHNPPIVRDVVESVSFALSVLLEPFADPHVERLYRDLRTCFATFREVPTLRDRIRGDRTQELFRLGRYLTILARDDIRHALETEGPERWRRREIIIAGKQYRESSILVELLAAVIEHETDLTVKRRHDVGDTETLFAAMQEGAIDLYPEFSGTILSRVLDLPQSELTLPTRHTREYINARLAAETDTREVRMGSYFGYDNPYVLVLNSDQAPEELKREPTISNLAAVSASRDLKFTADASFYSRKDGYSGLKRLYPRLEFREEDVIRHDYKYAALDQAKADVVPGYGTDHQLLDTKYLRLEDDQGFFPIYKAAPMIRRELLGEPYNLQETLDKFYSGPYQITQEDMARLLGQVNRAIAGDPERDPTALIRQVVERFLQTRLMTPER